MSISTSVQRKITKSLKRRGLLGTLKRCIQEPYYAMREYQPSRVRWRKRDKEFDQRFGTDTSGTISLSALDVNDPNWEYGYDYQPTDPKFFKTVIGELPIRYEEFTFIDLGSGKGRALFLAAEFPFRQIVGVEFSKHLHAIAEQNISRFTNPNAKCLSIHSLWQDAACYRLPNDPTVLYFFNPFQKEVMNKVLLNIEESLRAWPRQVYVVYRTPLLASLLNATAFLKEIRSVHGYAVYVNR